MNKKVISLLIVLLSVSSFADKLTLTLDDAIDMSKMKNKEIKKSEINLENYELEKKQAFKSALPEISYSGFYQLNEGDSDDSVNQYYLKLSQPLFNGFKVITAIKNSGKYVEYGELSLEKEKNQIGLEVLKSYLNLWNYKQKLDVLKESENVLKEKYRKTNEKYNLGLVTKTEVLAINYSLIEVETEVIQMNNSIKTTEISLKNSLGIENNKELELKDINLENIDIENIDIESDVKKVSEQSLAIRLQKITRDLTEASEVNKRANFMPSVNLVANIGNTSAVVTGIEDTFKDENISWNVGVQLSGSLYAWGKDLDAYKESKNNTLIEKYNEDLKKEELELNLRTKYLDILRLSKLKEALEKALENSKENFRLQEKKFENELINSTDFIEAENNLRQSELNLIGTKLDLYYSYEEYNNLLK